MTAALRYDWRPLLDELAKRRIQHRTLIEAVGMSPDSFQRLLHHGRDPRLSEVIKMARFLGVPMTSLFELR